MDEMMSDLGFVIEDNFLIDELPEEQIFYNQNGSVYEA